MSNLPPGELAHRFPDGFLWGAATAAHQVEGGNVHNDWWAWEQLPEKIRGGDRSGDACQHYERFREDFTLLRAMGHNAHRFSIEWSRIEPRPGVIDGAAVGHYREVLEAMGEAGLRPLVTLHHFTNPAWFAAAGGWEEPFSVDVFRAFTRLCVKEYGDLVDTWVTFNEPNVYGYQSYVNGIWPPQKKDLGAAIKVFRNMLRAHAAAFAEIKGGEHGARSEVGVAQHLRCFQPWRPLLPLDRVAVALPEVAFNQWFLRGCTDGNAGFPLGTTERVPEAAGTMDYTGVNYYCRDMVAFDPRRPQELMSRTFQKPGTERTDFDWELYPEGLHQVLVDTWRRYHKPIYILENGVADRADRMRARAIVAHLAELARAQREGADVRAYMHWTSMDNFEWSEGYSMRFGLMDVDFATQKRTPRASAGVYSAVIARNGLLWSELQEHYPRGLPYFVGASSNRSS